MDIAPGAIIAGRYRLEKRLAVGGMGSLWTAQHTQLDTLVAIKFMEPTHAALAMGRQRFEREAKIAASLKSAHVVQVHDYGVEGEHPYIVMELLQGEDLGKRLKRERRIAIPVLANILIQIARGLRRAHEAGLVHRDLKPPNIFMAKTDDDEVVKILDFGIAKDNTMEPVVGEGTRTGELMGSPHFMSPEQIRSSKDIDHRSDLWSLAVILFRATTGSLPFKGEAIGSVIAQILADPIPVPSSINPSLSPRVDAYFARAFTRDPAGRFQTAREMAEAFATLAAEPAHAGVSTARGPGSSTFPSDGGAGLNATPPPFTLTPFTPSPFTPPPFTPAPSSTSSPSTPAPGAASNDPAITPMGVRLAAPDQAPGDLLPASRPPSSSAAAFAGNDPRFTPRPTALSASNEPSLGPESHTTSGGGVTTTGEPLVQSTASPELQPARSSARWIGAAAVGLLLVGAGAALATRAVPPRSPAANVLAGAGAGDAVAASAAPPASAAVAPPAASAAVAPSSASASAAVAPSSASAAAPPGSAEAPPASAGAAVKPAVPVKGGPAPSGTAKKKPSWGF